MPVSKTLRKIPTLGLLAFAAACGGEEGAEPEAVAVATDATLPAAGDPAGTAPATAVTTPTGAPEAGITPAQGGQVIEVQMVMPGGANPRFVPSQITARPGDVLRFVNAENVHNVHFVEGPTGATLPPASPYLTQPNQTYEMKVELPTGDYTFQCDPHLAMGMVGELTVTQ